MRDTSYNQKILISLLILGILIAIIIVGSSIVEDYSRKTNYYMVSK